MEEIKKNSYKFNFEGNVEELIKQFFKKIKPIEGVVKYKMINWENFPKDIDESKKLAKYWSKQFLLNPNYSGLTVNLYFHLVHKSIRFEIKKYNIISLTDLLNIDDCKNKIFNLLNTHENKYTFNLSNFSDFPNLDNAKIIAKQWADEIESLDTFKDFKVIVFFNHSLSFVKIIFSKKDIKDINDI